VSKNRRWLAQKRGLSQRNLISLICWTSGIVKWIVSLVRYHIALVSD